MAESLKREVEASGFEPWRIAAALQLRNATFEGWITDTTLPDEKREKVRRCIRLMQAARNREGGEKRG